MTIRKNLRPTCWLGMQYKDGEELQEGNEIVFNKVANQCLRCTETSEIHQYSSRPSLLTVIIQLCLNDKVPKILETHTKMHKVSLSNTFCLNSLICIFSYFSAWHIYETC